MKSFITYSSFVASCFLLLATWSCNDPALPTAIADTATRDRLRGTWIPVSLTLKYQVGLAAPNLRDTTVTLTPSTAPLVVVGRANPIMPFTDTLYLATRAAAIDTFWLASRGVRQRGNFSVVSNSEAATMLRLGVPTYTRGQISRWNYDFVFHGTVSAGANNAPVYATTTYANYSPSIKSLTDSQLVLSFTSQGNVGNLPIVAITAANQTANTSWAGRPVLFTATYAKR
ncbi:MAG: hypothetical protein EAZ70_12705 [Runella slithyformis]|nr:MAG: hypothetical protein EAY79_12980 [Runella slithyformis]TAE89945.1 MAG: hypothetical protein EAZ80_13835 [Runella slithyformis]TAF23726.1 MAG: hypothetical protein EAZ70_12705 [Runella slithyformis]TAF49270.1 MAG: hypothetical protein EAZ63_01780 [Runella slithyformis]TAF78930.1 MAG: hypothetical protein EAZ50_12740 [Runella slithyformis]